MNTTILITGSNGFVGQNLNSYLQDNYTVKGISRKIKLGAYTYDTFYKENPSYDVLIHLAGKAHDLKKNVDEREYYEANFELTKRLFDTFLLSKAKKFIYLSSVKAVADVVDGVLDEEAVPNPQTVYGKSKRMAEEYIMQNLPIDKEVYILRPCMIHGPENKGNLNLLYSIVAKGNPYPLGAFENERSFLSVANLCFIIENLIQKNIPSGIYNVADDTTLSTTEIVLLIGKSEEKNAKIIAVPKFIIRAIARIGDLLPLPINTERLQKLTESYKVSNAKIKKALEIDLPFSSREGLLKTFQSFRK